MMALSIHPRVGQFEKLSNPDFSLKVGREAAENHDIDVRGVKGMLYSLQLLYHLVHAQQKRSRVFR